MFLLLVVSLVIMYEIFKLINMSEYTALLDGMKRYKNNESKMMSFISSKSSFVFILICEYIYVVIFIYLFFTSLYSVALYMLASMIVFTIIDKTKGTPNVAFRYLDSILTIALLFFTYLFLVIK